MLYFYVFASIVGCLLVGVSVAGGASGDGDGPDAGGGADVHALGDGDPGGHALPAAGSAPAHGDGGGGHSGSLGATAMALFSLQLWTYFLAFGGLTGILLRTVAHVGEPFAAMAALGVGLGTAVGARKVLRRLSAAGDSGTVESERLLGGTAEVLIPAAPGGTGKIRLTARGQTVDLLARASDGAALIAGSEVVILEIRDGIADVTTELPDSGPAGSLPANVQAQRAALPEGPPSRKG